MIDLAMAMLGGSALEGLGSWASSSASAASADAALKAQQNWNAYQASSSEYSQAWSEDVYREQMALAQEQYTDSAANWDAAFAESQYQFQEQLALAMQQQAMSEQAYYHGVEDRVKDAQAAGVHPLFAMGASSGYSGGGSLMGTQAPPSQTGGAIPGQPMSGSFAGEGYGAFANATRANLGSALSAIGTGIEKWASFEERAKASELDEALKGAQIQEIQSRTTLNLAEAQMASSGMKTQSQKALYAPSAWDYAQQGSVRAPKQGGVTVAGEKVANNPNWSDAQVAQDRWGDAVEAVYGAAVLGADLYHNYSGAAADGLAAAQDAYRGYLKTLLGNVTKGFGSFDKAVKGAQDGAKQLWDWIK